MPKQPLGPTRRGTQACYDPPADAAAPTASLCALAPLSDPACHAQQGPMLLRLLKCSARVGGAEAQLLVDSGATFDSIGFGFAERQTVAVAPCRCFCQVASCCSAVVWQTGAQSRMAAMCADVTSGYPCRPALRRISEALGTRMLSLPSVRLITSRPGQAPSHHTKPPSGCVRRSRKSVFARPLPWGRSETTCLAAAPMPCLF